MPNIKQHIEAARKVYELFWESYLSGDIENFASVLDEQLELIGTSESEIAHSKSEGLVLLEIQMHEVVGNVEKRNRKVNSVVIGDLILFNELCDIYFRNDQAWNFYSRLRLSTLLRETGEGWKVVQQHGSLPDHRVEGDETIAFEKINKENIELRDAVKRRTAELEIKNRELEVEAALERVRARTMGMQKAEELGEVATILFSELNSLVDDLWTCGFVFCEKNRQEDEWWLSLDNGLIQPFFLPNVGDFAHRTLYEGWEKGEAYRTVTLENEMLQEHYGWLMNIPIAHQIFEDMEASGIPRPNWQRLHAAYFKTGYLVVITEIPCEEEEIFKRFAQVFDLTYTRFLDLQKAEEQAREAQIEVAVERVRAQSMAMHHPDDLDKVNKELLSQLYKLGIPGLTGVSFYLIDQDEIVTVWDLSSPGNITNPNSYSFRYDSKKNPVLGEFIETLKSTKEDYFILDYPKEKLLLAIEELKGINLDVANMFVNAVESGALQHQWNPAARITDGILSIDLIVVPNSEIKTIVLKMAGAFNLAYQRFLDLQKAEAQAREARIEAALEKVRNRSLTMHKADELGEVVTVVVDKLRALNIPVNDGVAIVTFVEGSKDLIEWMENPGFPASIKFYQPYFEHPVLSDFWKAINEGLDFVAPRYSAEENRSFLEHIFEYGDYQHTPQEVKDYCLAAETYSYSAAFQKHSAIFINDYSGRTLSEEETEIVKRFSKVFEQAYIRFLDLQKSEAQAHEAQIELSLERIRAQVTAMKESSELQDIVVTMRSEFVKLSHEAHYFWHMRWLPEKYEKAMTSGDGTRIGMVMSLPRHIHGDIKLVADWEKSDEPSVVLAMDAETAVVYVDKMIKLGDFELVDHNAPTLDDIRHIGGLTFVMARTTHGEIGYSLPGMVPHPPVEAVTTLVRFAGVFDLAYRRFEDLKRTERQHREARIELALERTRTQSMLMQHSGELNEISKTFHEQLLLLGIDSEFSFVWLPDEEKQEHMFWATWVSEKYGVPKYHSKAINYPLDKTEPGTAACYVAWESGLPVHETFVSPGEIVAFFASWEELLRGTDQFKPELFPEGIYYTEAYMKYGCFGIDIRRQLTDNEKEILRRFSVEFERTYTRFLDLKKAEAQAIRAEQDLIAIKAARQKAEEALTELKATQTQLIQQEKLASLGQLTAGIAHEIKNPLNFVNNFSEVSMELLQEVMEEVKTQGLASQQIITEILTDIQSNLTKIHEHGTRANGIVSSMLQHSRGGSGKMEPTDLNALSREYVNLAFHGMRASKNPINVDIQLDLDEKLGKVSLINEDFSRVVLNLVNNAFDAMREKTKIGPGYKPALNISTKQKENTVEIAITDNGPGIPDEIKDKILQPFFTTKKGTEGTGLGLSITHDIVKAHGGELKVETIEGKGTEFIITLFI